MNEQSKLEEAQYFYSQMAKEVNNRKSFTHNLSAFLSATRSVLEYAEKEAQNKAGGKQWYEDQMAASLVLKFFTGKRNMNIYSTPVGPLQQATEKLTNTIRFTDSVYVTHLSAEEDVLRQSQPDTSEPTPEAADPPPLALTRYEFAGWIGREDVIALSQRYLDELQRMVEEGICHDILTE